MDTPSAAARSGFWRTTPPEAEKLPAGAPGSSAPALLKKMRRGPSLEKSSTGSLPTNSPAPPPALAASTAATLNAATAALWPRVAPFVASAGSSWPRGANRLIIRSAAPARFTTTSWSSGAAPSAVISNGSSLPFWMLVLKSKTVVRSKSMT